MKSYVSKFVFFFAALFVLALSFSVKASPWIDVGEDRLRSHLQLLVDSGVISSQVSAWPIMWSDVRKALDGIERYDLSAAQKLAVRELEFELRYQTKKGVKRSVELAAASARPLFRSFSSSYREEGELSHRLDWDGRDFSIQLSKNMVTDHDGSSVDFNLDQSYIAGVWGEWVLGVGAIDRWWGPSKQSSLILSNNARPVPGFMLRTKTSQSFESPWLSWIGDWHFTSFVGQMESGRTIPEAKLTGMRLTIKPTQNLEIGFSRAMQWGGEGRSEGLQTFFNSVTSKGENTESQSGNQLGGIDVRYSLGGLLKVPAAIYMQTIGEDEAGYLPSRRTYLFGAELTLGLENGSTVNGYIEYVNTAADPFKDEFFNMTYEHSIYQTGYRYRGRVLGTTFDNDAKVVSVGAQYVGANGDVISLNLNSAQLNRDSVMRGNTVSETNVDIWSADAFYQTVVNDHRLKLGLAYYSDFVPTVQSDVDETSVYAEWEYRF